MRKILAYTMTYILMLFIGVAGVFLFSNKTAPSSPQVPNAEPSTMDKVVSNLMQSKSINVDTQIDVNNEEFSYIINLNVSLNMLEGFEKLALQGHLDINGNDETTNIDFSYIDNNIYLSMFNTKSILTSNDINGLINIISSVASQFVPDFDVEQLLDINMLMGLMNNVQENKTEDKIVLSLDCGFGVIEIVTDLEYNIKTINIPQFTLEGIQIAPKVNFEQHDEFQDISKPTDEENYQSIDKEIKLLQAIINTFTQDFSFDGKISDFELFGAVESGNIYTKLNYQNYEMQLTLFDKIGYIEFGQTKIKIDQQDIQYVIDIIKQYFGNTQNFDLETKILGIVNELKNMQLSSLDLSKIFDLIEVDNDGNYYISYDNINLIIKLYEDRISQIAFNLNGENIIINFQNENVNIIKPEGKFISLSQLVEKINGVVKTALSDNVVLSGVISYKDLIANITAQYSYNNGNIYLNAILSIEGINVNLCLINNNVYLQYQGVKVKIDKNSIDYLKQYFNNQEISQQLNGVLLQILEIVSSMQINVQDSILNILYNNVNLNIEVNDDKLSKIEFSLNEISFFAEINYQEFTKVDINEDEYKNIIEFIEIINNTKDLFNNELLIEVNIKYQDIKVIGYLSINKNDIRAELVVNYQGNIINVKFIDNIIYAEYMELKVKLNIQDISKVLDLVRENNLIEIPNNFNDINFNFEEIIKIIQNSYINFENDELTLSYQNYNLTIKIVENCVNSLNITSNDLSASLSILDETKTIIVSNENEFIDIIKLLPFVERFIDIYQSNGISGEIVIESPYIEKILGRIELKYKVNFNNGVVGSFETKIFNKEVKIRLLNNIVYLDIDQLKYCFKISEIEDIIQTILNEFNINSINEINFDLTQLKLSLVNDNELQVIYNDLVVSINNDKNIIISLESTDFNVNITVKQGINQIENIEGEYLHITSLFNKIFNIKNLVELGQLQVSANLKIDAQNIFIVANINYKDFLLTHNLTDLVIDAKIQALNKEFLLKLQQEIIYISVDGLNVKLKLQDLEKLQEFIQDNFDFNIPNINLDINNLITSITSSEDSFELLLNNGNYLQILFNNDILTNVNYSADNIKVELNIDNSDKIEVILQEYYSNIIDLLPLCDKLLQFYNSKAVALDATIKTILLGNEQTFDAGINVDFSSSIKVDLHTSIEGVEISLYLRDNIIYLNIYGLKIKIIEQDIYNVVEFLNSNFGLNLIKPSEFDNFTDGEILLDFINKNFNNSSNINFSLGDIGSWENEFGKILWTFKNGLSLNIDCSNLLDVIINYEQLQARVEVVAYGDAVIMNTFDKNVYVSINEILNSVQIILDTLQTKQYNFDANAQVYKNELLRFDVGVDADLDILNGIMFSGIANLTGEQNIEVSLDYDNEFLYLNYDGLKVKINKQNLKEIMGIGLSILGIDVSGLSIFDNIDFDFNLDNIESIMPDIDFGNPLSILKVIKSLNYNDNQFNIELNSKYATNNSKNMNVLIVLNDERVESIDLSNIYTSDIEYFNLNIDFGEFKTIQPITENYIDISSSSSLLKGIINTSELNDYHIVGNLNILMDVIGINIDWTVPYDFQIKLVDKKPVIMATIGPMPVVAEVNNDVPYKFGDTVSGIYCGLDRTLSVYYVDGYVYFYRTERIPVFASKDRIYEKKLKVSVEEVLNNPMTYLQYALGFTDSIMKAISDSMELSKNRTRPIDLSKVLVAYDHNDDYYNLTINLGEIANNPQLDTMYVGIKTTYIESASKEYTTDLKFNMHMPFTNNIVMDLKTFDMQLIDINSELNFDKLYNYVNTYPYNEDAQWEASNGSWSLASAKIYTINFVTNGGNNLNSISQSANTPLSLPTYNNRIEDNGDYRYTYSFEGWYTTGNFEEGTLFTDSKMPRYDLTLYAKWKLISTQQTRIITFDTLGGSQINPQKYLPNVSVDLSSTIPTKATQYEDKGYNWTGSHMGKWTYIVTRYTFAGWYLDSDCTQSFNGIMPDSNITLYAKWDVSVTTEYYYNWERP